MHQSLFGGRTVRFHIPLAGFMRWALGNEKEEKEGREQIFETWLHPWSQARDLKGTNSISSNPQRFCRIPLGM